MGALAWGTAAVPLTPRWTCSVAVPLEFIVTPTICICSLSIWMNSLKSTGFSSCTVTGLSGALAAELLGWVTKEICESDEAAKTDQFVTVIEVTVALPTPALAVVIFPPAPISGLPATGAHVCVGPPLFVSGPRMAGVVGTLRILPTLPDGIVAPVVSPTKV
jgi:hypothetical protein